MTRKTEISTFINYRKDILQVTQLTVRRKNINKIKLTKKVSNLISNKNCLCIFPVMFVFPRDSIGNKTCIHKHKNHVSLSTI